jgi:hypothetical protein
MEYLLSEKLGGNWEMFHIVQSVPTARYAPDIRNRLPHFDPPNLPSSTWSNLNHDHKKSLRTIRKNAKDNMTKAIRRL